MTFDSSAVNASSGCLYNLCYPAQTAPAAVCQNGLMDHPIEPLAVRLTLAGAF